MEVATEACEREGQRPSNWVASLLILESLVKVDSAQLCSKFSCLEAY